MKEKFANEPLIIPRAAAVVFVIGTLVIWVFTRERKTSFNSSIEDFRAGLDAIAPTQRENVTNNGT